MYKWLKLSTLIKKQNNGLPCDRGEGNNRICSFSLASSVSSRWLRAN